MKHTNLNLSQYTRAELERMLQAASSKHNEDVTALLSDFSQTVADVIEDTLNHFGEPVFTNPTTGKTAASAYAVLRVLSERLTPLFHFRREPFAHA